MTQEHFFAWTDMTKRRQKRNDRQKRQQHPDHHDHHQWRINDEMNEDYWTTRVGRVPRTQNTNRAQKTCLTPLAPPSVPYKESARVLMLHRKKSGAVSKTCSKLGCLFVVWARTGWLWPKGNVYIFVSNTQFLSLILKTFGNNIFHYYLSK